MSSLHQPEVAYFSAEYAIADDLPIYAGGLGVLAADIVLEAASQNLPFYGIGLVYHEAFTGDDPDQRPMAERLMANGFELATDEHGRRIVTSLTIGGRPVSLQAWVKTWGRTKLILLDTRLDDNNERDQAICDRLYAQDPLLQLAQEMCLGFGGVAMLRAMALKPDIYHMNEGHAAMAGLALVLAQFQRSGEMTFAEAVTAVRPQLVGTKHTILPGAGLILDWPSVKTALGPTLKAYGATIDDLMTVASKTSDEYSDTKLMISLARVVNGVSKLHVALEREAHPQSQLIPVTNGIFRWRWTTSAWDGRPLAFDDAKFWSVHCENRRRLVEHVRQLTGVELHPDRLTVVWARRMAAYKRPELLVSDLERLAMLIHTRKWPMQFVVAGQSNPNDSYGAALMDRVIEAAARPELAAGLAYLPYYNPVNAKFLVRGADLWLNTPVRGYEACGTSGMKASLNGVLQFSTADGWIDEVDLSAIGWELSQDNPGKSLYDTLEQAIAPLFYHRVSDVPHHWVTKMRANMKLVQDHFTATRMLREYYTKLYEP